MKKVIFFAWVAFSWPAILFGRISTLAKTELTGPEIWESVFVPALHRKFHQQVDSTYKFEHIISQKKGKIVLDHAATRTADPDVYAMILRMGGAFGLKPNGQYLFPDKHLCATDLQLDNKNGFKWFTTFIKAEDFSPAVGNLIKDDVDKTRHSLSEEGLVLLEKLEREQKLSVQEAQLLVHEIVYHFCTRQGDPLSETAYTKIARESPEAANALLLGPDFNHIAYSLNDLDIQEWYGMDVITVVESLLKHEGFEMLPKIQGEPGGVLRQTSTLADFFDFELLAEDGTVKKVPHRAKFIEFIQRYPDQDAEGRFVFEGTVIKPFQGFLTANAFKIYESTSD